MTSGVSFALGSFVKLGVAALWGVGLMQLMDLNSDAIPFPDRKMEQEGRTCIFQCRCEFCSSVYTLLLRHVSIQHMCM